MKCWFNVIVGWPWRRSQACIQYSGPRGVWCFPRWYISHGQAGWWPTQHYTTGVCFLLTSIIQDWCGINSMYKPMSKVHVIVNIQIYIMLFILWIVLDCIMSIGLNELDIKCANFMLKIGSYATDIRKTWFLHTYGDI